MDRSNEGFSEFAGPAIRPTTDDDRRTEPTDDHRVFSGPVYAIPPTGLSVISDLDDTVKLTEVLERRKAVANTFVRPFVPLEPTASFLRELKALHVGFHYVSASPFFLSPVLEEFLNIHELPGGAMHLKPVRLAGTTLFDLFESGLEFKPPIIRKILEDFRIESSSWSAMRVKWTQVYAHVAAEFPHQILAVYIRRVRHSVAEDQRVLQAFNAWPRERLVLFDHATSVDALLKAVSAHLPNSRVHP